MYFWKTKLLVDDLRNNSIEAKSLKNYYLASSIILTVGFYLSSIQPRENLAALATEAIATIALTILGLNAAFNANGGSVGVSFLNKVVSISFPLLIKVLVAGVALSIGLGVVDGAGASHAIREWVQSIGTTAITAVMYWRLAVHIRSTNA
jgi:ABC-type antimicrobial peptide transport system permease subunit